MKKSKFVLGALTGAAIGAAAGILLAPRSGEETRKILADKSKEYAKKGKKIVEKGTEIAKEEIKKTADAVSEKMSEK